MILVCSATKEETQSLQIPDDLKENFLIQPLGIGYLEAAINLQKILLEKHDQIEKIIFLGTAGSLNKSLDIEDIVEVKQCGVLNIGLIENFSYIPLEYEIYELEKINPTENSKEAFCLSSLEITHDQRLSDKIQSFFSNKNIISSLIVENMELYGITKIAREFKIPCSSFLGITNYTDLNAHAYWKANNMRVSELMCNKLIDVIYQKAS